MTHEGYGPHLPPEQPELPVDQDIRAAQEQGAIEAQQVQEAADAAQVAEQRAKLEAMSVEDLSRTIAESSLDNDTALFDQSRIVMLGKMDAEKQHARNEVVFTSSAKKNAQKLEEVKEAELEVDKRVYKLIMKSREAILKERGLTEESLADTVNVGPDAPEEAESSEITGDAALENPADFTEEVVDEDWNELGVLPKGPRQKVAMKHLANDPIAVRRDGKIMKAEDLDAQNTFIQENYDLVEGLMAKGATIDQAVNAVKDAQAEQARILKEEKAAQDRLRAKKEAEAKAAADVDGDNAFAPESFEKPDEVIEEPTEAEVQDARERSGEAVEFADKMEEYGFRADGIIPFIRARGYRKNLGHKVLSVETRDGKDYFTVELSNVHNGKREAHVVTKTGSQLLNYLKDSDKRMQKPSRFRKAKMSQAEREDSQDSSDVMGAESRDKLRDQMARQERLALANERKEEGKMRLRDRFNLLVAKVMTGNVAVNREENDSKKKRLAYAIAGAGVLAVGFAAAKNGLLDHENVKQLSDLNPLKVETASAATEHASNASEAARAFHDTINSGDGITNSIMDYAQSHGKNISPERAYEIFQNTPESALKGIKGVKEMGVDGGLGYSSPGKVTIPADVIENWNKALKIK